MRSQLDLNWPFEPIKPPKNTKMAISQLSRPNFTQVSITKKPVSPASSTNSFEIFRINVSMYFANTNHGWFLI